MVPEYSRCMIADTLPKILAYMSAALAKINVNMRKSVRSVLGLDHSLLLAKNFPINRGWLEFYLKHLNLHPTNITQMVNIFSASVVGATLPKPTDVNDVNVKYSAVT